MHREHDTFELRGEGDAIIALGGRACAYKIPSAISERSVGGDYLIVKAVAAAPTNPDALALAMTVVRSVTLFIREVRSLAAREATRG